MSYDIAIRHRQACDPSAITTLKAALHVIEAAIADARNAGLDIETDPAVLFLARHLGAIATSDQATSLVLRRRCLDTIAEIRRRPALVVLAQRGIAYDAEAKALFHADGRRALRRLAEALMLEEDTYNIRSNKGGSAVSGEITLHGETIWVQLSLDCRLPEQEVLFRGVSGRRDYLGDRNHWTSVRDLLAPDRFAQRLCRKLGLAQPETIPTRLFA